MFHRSNRNCQRIFVDRSNQCLQNYDYFLVSLAMIALTDYGFSNIGVEVDHNRRDNQEDYSDVTVKPEYRVGLA